MQRNDIDQERDNDNSRDRKDAAAEAAEHPVPGIEHEPEPDAENMMPVEDGPGTF